MENAGDKSFEQRVREVAYGIWEREGRPEGREREHWTMAERELRAVEKRPLAAEAPARKSGSATKAAPGKRAASAAKTPTARSSRKTSAK